MSVAFILGQRNTAYETAGLAKFYETEQKVRDAYREASDATGIDVEHLVHNIAEGEQRRRVVASVGLAAAMIGIHDVLREHGTAPVAIGGLSLGAMVSVALAGSLERKDLYRLLVVAESADDPATYPRPEGCAGAVLPVGCEYDSFYGTQEGIWLAGDFGMHESGAFRMLLLAGYLDALQEAASWVPPEYFVFNEEATAPHCPLRQHVADKVAEHLKSVSLADPGYRLCSCLERGTLTTASEVRDLLVRNTVTTVYLDNITQEMVSNGAKIGVILGPSLPQTFEFPFPVVYVDAPDHMSRIAETALAAGISF